MTLFWRLIFGISAGIVAAVAGFGVFALTNALPAFIWRPEVLMVSVFLTIPLGLVLGVFGLVVSLRRTHKWFIASPKSGDGKPDWLRVAVVCVIWIAVALSYVAFVPVRTIEIAWTEEVLNDDDSVIVLRRSQTYTQHGYRPQQLVNYQLVSNKLSFAPITDGRGVQVETELVPVLLKKIQGNWYLVLGPRPGGYGARGPVAAIEVDRWGRNFNAQALRLTVLKDSEFVPVNWASAPSKMVSTNLLTHHLIPADQLQSLNNQHIPRQVAYQRAMEYLKTNADISGIKVGRHIDAEQPSNSQVRASFGLTPAVK